jgi:uncharacterized protein YndB with AHSA1/START domain
MAAMTDLQFDIYIAATPEAVWNALTRPEGVAKLYFGCRLDTTFEPGSPYRYVGPDGKGNEVSHVEGEVLACKPNELLQVIHRAGAVWQKGPKVFSSRLAYKIEGLGFATKLSVLHEQWEQGDPGHASNQRGWMIFLSSVKSYLETGKPLDLSAHS